MKFITRFKQLSRGARMFIGWCVIPLTAIIVMNVVALITLGTTAAGLIQMVLMAVWMVAVFGFIVLFDSRRRWPNTRAVDRLANVLMFKR